MGDDMKSTDAMFLSDHQSWQNIDKHIETANRLRCASNQVLNLPSGCVLRTVIFDDDNVPASVCMIELKGRWWSNKDEMFFDEDIEC
jgi:hypothetical protein